jgi:hypothetical protein
VALKARLELQGADAAEARTLAPATPTAPLAGSRAFACLCFPNSTASSAWASSCAWEANLLH